MVYTCKIDEVYIGGFSSSPFFVENEEILVLSGLMIIKRVPIAPSSLTVLFVSSLRGDAIWAM
jgi:hypothetical protein